MQLWALHSSENSFAPGLPVLDGSWSAFFVSPCPVQPGSSSWGAPAHQNLCSDPGYTPRRVGEKAASECTALLACFPPPFPRSRRKEPILGRLSVPCPCHAACSACVLCHPGRESQQGPKSMRPGSELAIAEQSSMFPSMQGAAPGAAWWCAGSRGRRRICPRKAGGNSLGFLWSLVLGTEIPPCPGCCFLAASGSEPWGDRGKSLLPFSRFFGFEVWFGNTILFQAKSSHSSWAVAWQQCFPVLGRSRQVVGRAVERRQRAPVGSSWEVYGLRGDGVRGAVCTLCLDEGFEKPSTNNCNFPFALW